MLAVQQLLSDSVENSQSQTPKGSALNVNLHHWIDAEIVPLSIHPSSTALSLNRVAGGLSLP